MTENNVGSGVITVWSDLGCPWASLALHTLRERARARGVALRIDHRAFPLELVNGEAIPKAEHDDEVTRITAVRPDLGWSAWSEPDWLYPVTTLPALHAVQAAKLQGLAAADALDAALRRAYFTEQRCISLLPVIEDVARRCDGIDAPRLLEALRAGAGTAAVASDLRTIADGEVRGSADVRTADGPYAANPGVDDAEDFRAYDASWADDLIARVTAGN